MKRRIAAAVLGAVFVLAGASPAMAATQRADDTITVTCVPTGFTYFPDVNALAGQTIANSVYNQVNPLGETCIAFHSDDD